MRDRLNRVLLLEKGDADSIGEIAKGFAVQAYKHSLAMVDEIDDSAMYFAVDAVKKGKTPPPMEIPVELTSGLIPVYLNEPGPMIRVEVEDRQAVSATK